jgi:hypothetical protein
MERSPELEQLVTAWFDAASRGDAALVDADVSPGEWHPSHRQRPRRSLQGRQRRRGVPQKRGRGRRRQRQVFTQRHRGVQRGHRRLGDHERHDHDARRATPCLHAGALSSTWRTACGSSFGPTPRSASRTRTSAGYTPADGPQSRNGKSPRRGAASAGAAGRTAIGRRPTLTTAILRKRARHGRIRGFRDGRHASSPSGRVPTTPTAGESRRKPAPRLERLLIVLSVAQRTPPPAGRPSGHARR